MKKVRDLRAGFLLFASIGISIWGNVENFKTFEVASNSRVPASQYFDELRSGSTLLERKLASEIAPLKVRQLASLGRAADPFENLRFGILEGKYSVSMEGDQLSQIAFIDTPNSEGRPTAIAGRKEFLAEISQFLDVKGTPERVSALVHGTKTTETYRVKTSKADSDLLISITVDDLDRLIGLHTEHVSSLKVF